jgi:hypothetical protein
MIFLRIFKNNRTLGTAGVILFLIALFVPSFINDFSAAGSPEIVSHTCMPFYNLIFGSIHKLPVLNHLVTMLIIMTINYTLIRTGIRDQLLSERSLMPAFFFMLFTASIPAARQVSPGLVASLFYLFSYVIIFDVQEKKEDTLSIFTASLILALGSMFCLKLIWFVPLIWVSLLTLRSVTFRELFYPVTAYLLLGLFLFTWYWGVRGNVAELRDLLAENLAFTGSFRPYHDSVYLLYGYILLLVLIASVYMMNHFLTMKTMAQNIYQVMFYMFLAGVLFFVFISGFDPSALVFIAFPVSFILSNYFHRRKSSWFHELAIWILLGLVVYVQLMV